MTIQHEANPQTVRSKPANAELNTIGMDDVARRLLADGWAKIGAHQVKPIGEYATAFHELVDSLRELPLDPHCGSANRARRYGQLIMLPWLRELWRVPPIRDLETGQDVAVYVQSASINREYSGTARKFSPLNKAQYLNPYLRWLIWQAFDVLPERTAWSTRSVQVGLHFIRLIARRDVPSASSPDEIHRDAEPYTFAFLFDRFSVDGGENLIATVEAANHHPSQVPPSAVLERFTLTKVLDGYVVDDDRVSHYVAPVTVCDGATIGWRTILLIDFAPLMPVLEG